jgi:hypothetical protein
MGIPEEKRLLEIPGHRWRNKIKFIIQGIK